MGVDMLPGTQGEDEKIVFGSDGRVLDGFDAGFEKGALTGNRTGAKAPAVKVKFGDAACPGGVDMVWCVTKLNEHSFDTRLERRRLVSNS